MPRWIGLLGSWALLILAVSVLSLAAAGEVVNVREAQRFGRYELLDKMIAEKHSAEVERLKGSVAREQTGVATLQNQMTDADKQIGDLQDTDQTIVVSTAENKIYLMRGKEKLFEAVCSTGKGATSIDGKTMVFDTPIGKLHVISKETNPLWVPPDWHYAEEAKKKGLRVVKLQPGQSIDADSGSHAESISSSSSGVFSWMGGSSSHRFKVKNNTVVEEVNGEEHELPPGQMIQSGGMLIVPPVGTPQRKFDKVLGAYRLNMGNGYAIHGTQAVDQLGRSVSHGCVRVGEADLARLFSMTNVGDEVIIY